MTVFKTYLKILNKYKLTVIIYTVIMIFFAFFNMKTVDNVTNFNVVKPDILIVNNDVNVGITEDLVNYLTDKSNVKEIEKQDEAISDALFYREISYIIYIPEGFRENVLNGQIPEIEVKSTGDYEASLANIILERYMGVLSLYNEGILEKDLIKNIHETIDNEVKINLRTKLDTDKLEDISYYFNFSNYCFLASLIQVVCLIMATFKEDRIVKRNVVSSSNYHSLNNKLLCSNMVFGIVLWLFYIILAVILFGNVMFSSHGLVYILNSFVFMVCSLIIAFLLANLVNSKDAINGIVNVIALGSSFLCGAFVPMEMLPKSVLNLAHILPSYWFIKNNEIIKSLEVINLETLNEVIVNIDVILIFIGVFLVLNYIVLKRKRKID